MFVVAFLFLDVTWVVIRGVVNICIQGIVSIQGACLLNPVHCISPECYFNPGRVDIPNVFEFWHCRVPFAVLSLALYVYRMVLASCRSDDAMYLWVYDIWSSDVAVLLAIGMALPWRGSEKLRNPDFNTLSLWYQFLYDDASESYVYQHALAWQYIP